MPQPSPERRLIDLALRNLRRCFPNSEYVRRLDAAAATKANGGRCTVRGCVWPAARDGKCRHHLLDSVAERSMLPSELGFHVTQLHGHGYQAAER